MPKTAPILISELPEHEIVPLPKRHKTDDPKFKRFRVRRGAATPKWGFPGDPPDRVFKTRKEAERAGPFRG